MRATLGLFGPTLPFATYFPAVLVSALFGGRIAGLLAIPLSIIAVWWAFAEPFYSFGSVTPREIANYILFALSSLLVVWLALVHRQLILSLEDKERQRMLLVGELEHRSKNTLALMEALVGQTVKDKDAAATLITRMRAVTSTQELVGTLEVAATLDVLLVAILQKPHGADRVELNGPEVMLSGRQATAMRLVIHEMTTNALKYGGLSKLGGKVAADWSVDAGMLTFVWSEKDGPSVSPPAKYNFGSRLIMRTLKTMNAEFEPTFAETGYCYKIRFKLET
jgi:two-component sensor histidine kinase